MITPFLLLGTVWFWVYIIIPFLFLIWFVESEQSIMAAVIVASMAVAFLCFGDPTVLSNIKSNPSILVLYASAYIFVGIAWGFVKWFFYVLKRRDQYTQEVNAWQITYNDQAARGMEEHHRAKRPKKETFQPAASKNKGRIIFWMSYWPASALWTLLNDPLTRVFSFIYRRLGRAFDDISKTMFANYE